MSEFNLDREVSIRERVDAEGRKWAIHVNRQNGLAYIRPEPDRVDAVIPKGMIGLWTKPSLLDEQLIKYLGQSWDKAEKANADAERKRQAAREYEAHVKAEAKRAETKAKKVEDVSGTADN